MTDAAAALQRSLTEAGEALSNGDAAEAERRAKAITALVRAERDAAEFATVSSGVENDDEYELSGFLRGCLGSTHAMQAPHPAGARIVVLNDQLTRMEIGAHEWNEHLHVIAPPYGLLATDARAAVETVTLPHAAARPWAPTHVRAVRSGSGDVTVSWVRCARSGGDAWGPGDVPLGENAEAYQRDILDGAVLKRSVTIIHAYLFIRVGRPSR